MGQTLLVIDDDVLFLRQLTDTLSGAGFQMITARDVAGAESMLMAGEPHISALIVDLVLPGKTSGLDVVSLVTRKQPTFKIIVTSAVYRNPILEYISRHLGADAFIEKSRPGEPFNATEWVDTVRRLVGGSATAAHR